MPVGEAKSYPCPLRLLRRMIPHAEGTHEAPRGSPLTAGCDHLTGADEVEVRQSLPGLWYDQKYYIYFNRKIYISPRLAGGGSLVVRKVRYGVVD